MKKLVSQGCLLPVWAWDQLRLGGAICGELPYVFVQRLLGKAGEAGPAGGSPRC